MTSIGDPPTRANFYNELNKLDIGSPKFMEVFAAGEKLYLDNQTVNLNILADGINFSQKIGNFAEPHLVQSVNSLGFEVPNISFNNLSTFICPIEKRLFINSFTQNTMKCDINEFVSILQIPVENREVALNLLSLEFSGLTSALSSVKVPKFVEEMSLAQIVEKAIRAETESTEQTIYSLEPRRWKEQLDLRVKHEKYLIISHRNSLTDVHVDFSGTAVFYHVVKGKKVFYLAPKTKENLSTYCTAESLKVKKEWLGSKFGDQWQRIEISSGETAFLPPGYIHFVYTPEDSIVVGGNFLLADSLPEHIRMTQLEQRCLKRKLLKKANMFQFFVEICFSFVDLIFLRKSDEERSSDQWKTLCRMLLTFLTSADKMKTDEWYWDYEKQAIIAQLKSALDGPKKVLKRIENIPPTGPAKKKKI